MCYHFWHLSDIINFRVQYSAGSEGGATGEHIALEQSLNKYFIVRQKIGRIKINGWSNKREKPGVRGPEG